MTLATNPQTLDAAAIARISDHLDEPDWLRELRAAWWDRASATPPPTGEEEEWRRTDLGPLPRRAELLVDAPAVAVSLPAGAADAGVVVSDLRTAVRDHPDLVRRYLGRGEAQASHAHFWALAQAGWTGGLFVHVPRGVAVDGTIVARTTLDRADVTYLPVTLVVAEEGSIVTVLEEVASPDGDAGWFGGIVEVRAGQAAQVRYANLQQLGDGAWNIGAQRVEVGQDATVTTLNAEVGSRVTKVGVDVQMTGKGGTSKVLGMLAAGDDQHIDINAHQDLAADHTTSDLLYLSALYDRARAAFYGVTRVEVGTKQTASYQECRNLLLSPNAGAEPIPVLEIKANDILRCGHGATAGAIDPIQLFYAQTRGLDADAAERMIVRGFFEQVVAQVDDEMIRERVLAALARRIGTTEGFA
ncbi:MAG TPA: SufD family Fe-S cluster assembly protein [Candidatus Limnocylindrales bacterium]|nr:SufD family Fe-S cluster assembly protein [Candidatus Limnocylindrales bacterium]